MAFEKFINFVCNQLTWWFILAAIVVAFYEKDPENANFLVSRPIHKLSNSMDLMHLAFRFKCIEFMNMKCIKTILNKKWYDKAELNTPRSIVSTSHLTFYQIRY